MPAESAATCSEYIQRHTRHVDLELSALAQAQHGVVARRQLLAAGMGTEAIALRLRHGRLHRLHAGVYAVGHSTLTPEGRWMAGLLAAGPQAVLSHVSAAGLWGLLQDGGELIDVTAPRSARSRGLLRRHVSALPGDEVTEHRGLPVTTPSRTLLDIALIVSRAALERAIREVEFLRLPIGPPFDVMLRRHAGRRGIVRFRECLQRAGWGEGFTRSRLEDRFLLLANRAGLPPPATNASIRVGGKTLEIDCVWRDVRLAVELDGHAAHGTRAAFEADRERDRTLQAAGWRVIRVTWRQLEAPESLATDLRRMLHTP